MAAKRKDMSIVKQILRLREQGQATKAIIRASGISKNTVKKYLRLAEVSDYSLKELLEWEDEKLDIFFKTNGIPTSPECYGDLASMFPYFEMELKRVGVTRWILWGEYRHRYPEGYGYSRFCHHLNIYFKEKQASFHQDHLPGDKIFMDFAGKKLTIVDKQTGELKPVEVFVALLGYSQLTYVEALYSQKQPQVIAACTNALHYFNGSPKALVCDNLKAAVTKACRFEPSVNVTFNDFANYYKMVVLPTRSREPKDKALVERAVGIAYNRIYAPLRDKIFFSLDELNASIREVLSEHNAAKFQNKEYGRKELYEKEEKATLGVLPVDRYELKHYCELTVMKNCYIQLREDFHYYSVPYRFIGKRIKLIYTTRQVAIYYQSEQIAYYMRDYARHKYTTVTDHLPSSHRFVSEWSSEKFLNWAENIAPIVRVCISAVLENKPHPEQAYKSCVGILSLARKVGSDELIVACNKAHELGEYSYTFIKRIIQNGYAREGVTPTTYIQTTLPLHDNIRGADHYK